MNDSKLIVIANKEIASNRQDEALWRKAMVLTGADKEKAKQKYVKMRVLNLKKKSSKEIDILNIDLKITKPASPKKPIKTIPKPTSPKKPIKKTNKSSSPKNPTKKRTDTRIPPNAHSVNDDEELSRNRFIMTIIFIIFITFVIILNDSDENTASYQPQKTDYIDNKYSLKIDIVPKNATIKITNINTKFYQGMLLKKGRYNVTASKNGYKIFSGYFDFTEDTSYKIILEKNKLQQKYSLIITTVPLNAKVQIMNIKPKYTNGIKLKKGDYHIKISKEGFKTVNKWINIQKNVSLKINLIQEIPLSKEKVSLTKEEENILKGISNNFQKENILSKKENCILSGKNWKFNNLTNTWECFSKNRKNTYFKGEELFKKCAGCHGSKAEKKALNKSEVISGWSSSRIKNALKGYKDGSYGGSMKGLMKGQVASYGSSDIEAISEYISNLRK